MERVHAVGGDAVEAVVRRVLGDVIGGQIEQGGEGRARVPGRHGEDASRVDAAADRLRQEEFPEAGAAALDAEVCFEERDDVELDGDAVEGSHSPAVEGAFDGDRAKGREVFGVAEVAEDPAELLEQLGVAEFADAVLERASPIGGEGVEPAEREHVLLAHLVGTTDTSDYAVVGVASPGACTQVQRAQNVGTTW